MIVVCGAVSWSQSYLLCISLVPLEVALRTRQQSGGGCERKGRKTFEGSSAAGKKPPILIQTLSML
eukprot:3207487-Amphidinium_carterae.1